MRAKLSCAHDIEWTLALRKLDLILQRKNAPTLDDVDFLQGKINTRKLYFQGILQDYESEETKRFDESIKKLESRVDSAIRREFVETAGAYGDMSFKEGDDLTVVAQNAKERAMIIHAAELLGYLIKETDEDSEGKTRLAFYPPEKHHTPGNLEQILATRINNGIKKLFDDYATATKSIAGISRPTVRAIVSMVDAEAKVFRSPARSIHPDN